MSSEENLGSKEFSTPIRGSGAEPIATTGQDAFTTNNFADGGAIEATSYPHEIDPEIVIEELVITETGDQIRADIETIDGNTIEDVPLRGASVALNTLEINTIELRDPEESGDETFGMYIGE